MRALIFFLFGLFLVHPAFSQGPVGLFQSQNFDGEDSTIYCPVSNPKLVCIRLDPDTGNIWFAGNRYKGYKQPPGRRYIYTDTNAYYRSNDTSSFTIDFITAKQTYLYMQLSWSHYMDLGKGDYGKVELSEDSGQTWTNCFKSADKIIIQSNYTFGDDVLDTLPNGDIVFTGAAFGFWDRIDLIYDFYKIYPNDRIQVRFTFVSDSVSSANLGWVIDSMEVFRYYPGVVNKITSSKALKVYPNPTSNRLQIESNQGNPSEKIEHLILFNALGQKVDEWFEVPSKFEIETGKYPNGLYYLRTRNSGYTGAASVVIQHE
jgi:hypothetical protein